MSKLKSRETVKVMEFSIKGADAEIGCMDCIAEIQIHCLWMEHLATCEACRRVVARMIADLQKTLLVHNRKEIPKNTQGKALVQ